MEIKDSLKNLEDVLAKASSPEALFTENPQFNKAFASAHKAFGILENEWIQEEGCYFSSRKAIRMLVDEIETIEAYVQKNAKPGNGRSLKDRLDNAKRLLDEVNNHLNDYDRKEPSNGRAIDK